MQTQADTGATSGGRPLPPVKAFVMLIGVLVVAGAGLWLLRPEAETGPAGLPESDNFALTNAEAIHRFKQLDELRLQAYEKRDASLIRSITTEDSALRQVGVSEIAQLIDDKVFSRTTFDTKSLTVSTNTGNRIVLRQVVAENPRFVTAKGEDITTSAPVRRTVQWTLDREGAEWLLFDAEVLSDRDLSKQ